MNVKNLRRRRLQFGRCRFPLIVVVNILRHLPHLHDIIFGNGADDPGFVQVPAEIGYFRRVASVDEEEFWWAVLGILGALLLADFGEVPNVEAAIGAGRGEDGFIMRGPLDLEDFVFVRFEGVELKFEVSKVPECDGFVGAASGEDEFRVRVETEAVDFGGVGIDGVRRFADVVATSVPDHKFLVISDRPEKTFVEQMPGDVFDNCRVAGENGFGIDTAVFFRLGVDIPQANRMVIAGR